MNQLMETKHNDLEDITMAVADKIVDGTIETCRLMGFKGLAVSVVNAAGQEIMMKVMDD